MINFWSSLSQSKCFLLLTSSQRFWSCCSTLAANCSDVSSGVSVATYPWQRYLLTDGGEGEAHKGTGQVLCVHLISHSFKVILLPRVLLNLTERTGNRRGNEIWKNEMKDSSALFSIFSIFSIFSNVVCRCFPAAAPQPGAHYLIHHRGDGRTVLWADLAPLQSQRRTESMKRFHRRCQSEIRWVRTDVFVWTKM